MESGRKVKHSVCEEQHIEITIFFLFVDYIVCKVKTINKNQTLAKSDSLTDLFAPDRFGVNMESMTESKRNSKRLALKIVMDR